MVKLAKHPHEDLIEYLHETLGDALQAVVQYHSGRPEILYARSGQFVSPYAEHPLATLGTSTRMEGERPPRYPDTGTGTGFECLVGLTDTAYEVVLYPTTKAVIHVSFDRDTTIQFQRFLDDCLAIVT